MAKCKICGAEFTPCKTNTGAFNWRHVACCYEHGQEYLRLVMEARGLAPVPDANNEKPAKQKRWHK